MNTVNTTKMLMLAAIGSLAIGAGAAMAQIDTSINPGVGFSPPQVNGPQPAPVRANQVQSGSSDVDVGGGYNAQDYRYQWGNLNNPG